MNELCKHYNRVYKNWPTKKLGDVLEIYYGKGLHKNNRVDSGKYLAYGSNGSVYSTNESLTTGEIIVIGRKGTAGALYFVSRPCWPIDTTFFAKTKGDKSLKFIYYLLLTKNLPRLAIVTGVPGINRTTLANVSIQIPPLKIQKQIVGRLDKIAEAQKLNDELFQKSDELFQSLLHKELNPVGKNWGVKKLEGFCEFQYGYTDSAQDTGDYRFIRITDISENGELKTTEAKYIKQNGESDRYILDQGDLVVARTGATYGKILFYDSKELAVFASYLVRIKPDENVTTPKFIWLFSRTKEYWRQAQSLMTGSGQQQFNANKIKEISIPLPPLQTQKQIVEKLSAAQEYKKQLLAQKSLLKELFDSVLHKSINGELN